MALTPSSIRRMYTMASSTDDPSFSPVVQVLQVKKIEPRTSSFGDERWKVVLSDGELWATGLLSASINHFINSGLVNNSVIRITEFVTNIVSSGQNVIIVVGLEIAGPNPGYRIGNPVNIRDTNISHGGISSGSNSAAGGSHFSNAVRGTASNNDYTNSSANAVNTNTVPQSISLSTPNPRDFIASIDAARQRVASAERWKESTEKSVESARLTFENSLEMIGNAEKMMENARKALELAEIDMSKSQRENRAAAREAEDARAYLAELEFSHEVIDVDEI